MATVTESLTNEKWFEEVRRLARDRDAVILAHNYELPPIQDVADHVGDSLELSRIAASEEASTIVFCGVHFMAETAKILSYDKRVLIPDLDAGCSLAASMTADQLRAWKADHPEAVVVMYVNTTAEVKAEADYCCTSANAVQVVNSISEGKEILFGPDMFLGSYVERMTGRKMHVWMGECHVHAGIQPSDIDLKLTEHPDAELHVHPECGCSSQCMYLASTGDLPKERTFFLGTGGMVKRARETSAQEVIVATETGMLHRLRTENPSVDYVAANESAVCQYMKMITPQKLLHALEHGVYEVNVPATVADRARLSIKRMLAVG
ncbi:MAG: quinolinate synthase NadA [Actinomycetota bacterium]|nr:quinolinate synthase NadA [Actinomycetota bacterium]